MKANRPWVHRLGIALGPTFLRSTPRLTRTLHLHQERDLQAKNDFGSVIYALWHGRLWLLAAYLYPVHPAVLVSLSKDGELIAQILQRLGLHPVRGSSSRRGREGLQELEAELRGGRTVAMTPDGPRGPNRVAQMGAVALAARTGKPIIPLSSSAARAWVLRSWDRFLIPQPGTRGAVVYGEPLLVPSTDDLEPWRLRLQNALTEVEEEADRAVGRE